MKKDARFYFANLGADVARCVKAANADDQRRYEESLLRARNTLENIRGVQRPEAYEEGLLLLRALEYARRDNTLASFESMLSGITAPFVVS